ncbi:uncharacterized protein LOC113138184 isoform X2 [Mastacembelus armatus]|uniref:uncharacterized protein LOC113138184 isoform X2 n=1 Tax=Mastacembelus armatus TaxID=205130 RepID=UPI000E45945F|nr:uncharacterized protein LOC113138184 isoform X2 [Mastacembelus armatus]
MENGGIFMLLFMLLGAASALSFYGDSISFMPPQRRSDGTFKVDFYHRENGRSSCQDQSGFTCDSGVCTSFDVSSVLQTDQDNTGQGRWCQSESHTTAIISTNETSFSVRSSDCCWVSNIDGQTTWTSYAELDLGIRSDTRALNSCPLTTTVSSLRVPRNCFSTFRLLTYDPDNDRVRCRLNADASAPSNIALDENQCSLSSTGEVGVGVHVFELMLEDFPTQNINLTYANGTSRTREAADTSPVCTVTLQFSMEILPPIPTCELGHVQPVFLSTTPSHGEVLHASVGQTFHLSVEAQARHSTIHDFQISGPQNMTKVFADGRYGVAAVTLSWTPQQRDLHRLVPVCFTAETNETQSEMRCVVVIVTQTPVVKGKATVECSPNKMTVTLDKASMPGIDVNYLKLSDPTCSLTSNDTHIMGSMSFSTCGTQLEDKGDVIAFKNEIHSFEVANEIITRRKRVKIGFSCQFPKSISISTYYNLRDSDYIFTESSFGSFGYSFEIFQDNNFTDKVEASAYPVQVHLLDKLYMGIQAKSELSNVTLFVESCKATPDDNPENALSYDLVKNGCIKDETFKVYSSDRTSFNFEVQAFKFTGNYDLPGSPFSRCAQGCLQNPARRRKRELSMQTAGHYISQGPLQFVGPDVPSGAKDGNNVMKKGDTPAAVSPPHVSPDPRSSGGGWEVKAILNANISTLVLAGCFVASVVGMAVVLYYFSRKRNAEDSRALIVSEWEN